MAIYRIEKFQSTPPVRGATAEAEATRSLIQAFQSTPPVRGATTKAHVLKRLSEISIHAPRAGGDR